MSGGRNVWLICYDIADDRRRNDVHHLMRAAGDRLQYSVFRCALTEMELVRLRADLEQVVHAYQDQVMFIPLGSEENPKSWVAFAVGRPVAPPARTVRVVT